MHSQEPMHLPVCLVSAASYFSPLSPHPPTTTLWFQRGLPTLRWPLCQWGFQSLGQSSTLPLGAWHQSSTVCSSSLAECLFLSKEILRRPPSDRYPRASPTVPWVTLSCTCNTGVSTSSVLTEPSSLVWNYKSNRDSDTYTLCPTLELADQIILRDTWVKLIQKQRV